MPQRITDKPSNPRNFKNRNKITFRIKRDRMKLFRWDLVARNGSIIASSPDEGYARIGRCLASIGIVMEHAMDATIEHPEETSKSKLRLADNFIFEEDDNDDDDLNLPHTY